MIRKWYFYLSCFLFSILSCFLKSNQSSPDDSKNSVVIRIADFEVRENQYQKLFDKFVLRNNSASVKQLHKHTIGIYTILGLFAAEAQFRNFDEDPEIGKEVLNYQKMCLIEAAKKNELKNQPVSEKEIKACYDRASEELLIGYIRIRKEPNEIKDEILKEIQLIGIDKMMHLDDGVKFIHWKEEGVIFERHNLIGGSLVDELEAAAYGMRVGEVKVVEFDSMYHIFQLFERKHRTRRAFGFERKKIINRLSMTKLLYRGGNLIDRIRKKHAVEINDEILPFLNLYVAPLPPEYRWSEDEPVTKQRVIAILDGRKITVGQLKSKISYLPDKIQSFFYHKKNRIKAVSSLLIMEFGDRIDLKNSSGNKPFADFRKLMVCEPPKSESGMTFPWLYPQLFSEINKLQLDMNLVNVLEIPEPSYLNNENHLAKCGKWTLTVGGFFDELKRLEIETVIQLTAPKNKVKFIEYLAKKHGTNSDINSLQIDHSLLDKIDLVSDFVESTCEPLPINENEIIASIDTFSISLGEFRNIVSALPKSKKAKYINPPGRVNRFIDRYLEKTCEEAMLRQQLARDIEKLLYEKIWLIQAKNEGLDTLNSIVEMVSEKKYFFLAQKLFWTEITQKSPEIVSDLNKHLPNQEMNQLTIKKMKSLINRLNKKFSIFWDKSYFEELGIPVDDSMTVDSDFFVSSLLRAWFQPEAAGKIRYEVWKDIYETYLYTLRQLKDFPDFPENPTSRYDISAFSAPESWTDNYGVRICGYFHPPVTDYYMFSIASQCRSELWLSSDADPGKKELISNVYIWTLPQQWSKYFEQHSNWTLLEDGKKYYIEALLEATYGGDHLSAAWRTPDRQFELIDGEFLSPCNN